MDRHLAHEAADVGRELLPGRARLDVAVPDVVHQPLAVGHGAVRAGDRVEDHVRARRDAVGQAVLDELPRAGREPVLRHGPAPPDVAGVLPLHLGEQRPARGRADAVGEDDQLGVLDPAGGEAQLDPVLVLVEAGAVLAQVVALGPEVAEQRPVQRPPGGVPPQGLVVVQHLVVAAQVADPAGGGAQPGHAPVAALLEPPRGDRLQHDPATAVVELGRRPLVHVDREPEPAQEQRRGEPADRAADDRGPQSLVRAHQQHLHRRRDGAQC